MRWRSNIIFTFFCFCVFCVFAPASALAVGVGFIPKSGLWLSREAVLRGETVRVYTVIVNNEYSEISGAVGFYANDQLIGASEVFGLKRERAEQVAADWRPGEGSYTLSARFIRLSAATASGVRKDLDVSEINSANGSSLVVGGGGRTQSLGVRDGGYIAEAIVEAKKQGSAIMLVPAELRQAEIPPAGIPAAGAPADSGPVAVSSSADAALGELPSLKDAWRTAADRSAALARNREAIARAAENAAVIKRRIAADETPSSATSSIAAERGQAYFVKAGNWLRIARRAAGRAWDAWLAVSDNNNPARIILIIGALLFARILLRLYNRRRRRFM